MGTAGGYHDDQFFRNTADVTGESTLFAGQNAYGSRGNVGVSGSANPNFIYPDRTIRTHGADGDPQTFVMKRGYMRSLITEAQGQAVSIKKCQFQFNPATLQQAVSSMTGITNFFQQDPAQWGQPIGSNVNFTFDLFFDRSMEVNNASNNSAPPNAANPWETGDPGQVGVLRDLAALYAVIGQTVTADMMALRQLQLEQQMTLEYNSLNAEEQKTNEENKASTSQNAMDFLRNTAGNAGILMPTPIRIMFSSLYMVEGLITNTNVTFTKFSSTMVPMQCYVTLTMEAKYLGFAQKNTFMTWIVEQMAVADRQARKDTYDAAPPGALAGYASSVGPGVKKIVNRALTQDADLSYMLNPANDVSAYFSVHPGYSTAEEDDRVAQLLDDGTISSVSTDFKLLVYGPYTNLAKYDNTVVGSAEKAFWQETPDTNGVPLKVNRSHTVTDKKGWRKEIVDSGTPKAGAVEQDGEAKWIAATKTYDATKYYIVKAMMTMTVKTGGTDVVGTGVVWKVIAPNSGSSTLSLGIPMSWPNQQDSGFGPTVPADNAATAPAQPGATSTVGAPTNSGLVAV